MVVKAEAGWRSRIRRRGYPDITKTFETKADAEKWARSIETEIDKGKFVSINEALNEGQRAPIMK